MDGRTDGRTDVDKIKHGIQTRWAIDESDLPRVKMGETLAVDEGNVKRILHMKPQRNLNQNLL